jgi:hypothetical protein
MAKPGAGKNFLIHRNGKTAPRLSQDSVAPILEAVVLKSAWRPGVLTRRKGEGSLEISVSGLK